uniref:G protein-coupled receptor n=1 Tax=Steinernema glaseri TaxID=37863 RepID=A0A1I8AIA0_9BILA
MRIVQINQCFILSYFVDFFFQAVVVVLATVLVYEDHVMFSCYLGLDVFILVSRLIFAFYLCHVPVMTLPPYMAFQVCRAVCSATILPVFAVIFNFDAFQEHDKILSIVLVMCGVVIDCIYIILYKYCVVISEIHAVPRNTRYYDYYGRNFGNGHI